jgi:thioredoxin 1
MSSFPILDPQQVAAVAARPGLVMLDFWQESCAPCRALEPRLAEFADQHPGAFTGYRVDVDADRRSVEAFDVMSIPTVVLLRDGREVARLDGLIRLNDLSAMLRGAGTAREAASSGTATFHDARPGVSSSSRTDATRDMHSDGCVSGR